MMSKKIYQYLLLSLTVNLGISSCINRNVGTYEIPTHLCLIKDYRELKQVDTTSCKIYDFKLDTLILDSIHLINNRGTIIMINSLAIKSEWKVIDQISEIEINTPIFEQLPNLDDFGQRDYLLLKLKSPKNLDLLITKNVDIENLDLNFVSGGRLDSMFIDNSKIKVLTLNTEKKKLTFNRIHIESCNIEEINFNGYFENIHKLLTNISTLNQISIANYKDQDFFISELNKMPNIKTVMVQDLDYEQCKKIDSICSAKIIPSFSLGDMTYK